MTDASTDTIVSELDALGAHYIRPNRSPAEHTRFLRDFVSDLGPVTPDVVRRACQSWRQSDANKFPTPGQLLKKIEALTPQRSAAPGPWREVSEAEYDRMTLTEKIDHQTILANECDQRAGPMWRNGEPVALEDMPDVYHTWKRRASDHRKEAKRLRERLVDAKSRYAA